MPIQDLPDPAGDYRVGTTNFTLDDESRQELLTHDPVDKRELFVEVWYPADFRKQDLPNRRTLWQELYQGKTDQVSFFMSYLKEINTNSYPDIIPNFRDGPFPIILFNHGLQMFTSQNTLLMEHLASHGYVVVSIGHPYESLRVNLSEERTVIPEFISSADKFREAMNWIKKTSAPILAAQDSIKNMNNPQHRAKIMLTAINKSEMNEVVSRWETDNRFILDQLLSSKESEYAFQNVIDSSKIGVMGMSIGGATATEICKSDDRITAGINVDGLQYGTRNDMGLKVPFMMIYSMDGAGSNEFLRLEAENDFHEYTFLNTRHADFTDMIYIWPILRIYGQLGNIPAQRMVQLSNSVILNFWDHYLKERPLKSFDGKEYTELQVRISAN